MAYGLPGTDNPACVFGTHRGYDEQDSSRTHAEAQNALLAVFEPVIEKLDLLRIVQGMGRSREADAVLAEIGDRLGLVPFVFDARLLPDTGTSCNALCQECRLFRCLITRVHFNPGFPENTGRIQRTMVMAVGQPVSLCGTAWHATKALASFKP
jgi:hypothetical protein